MSYIENNTILVVPNKEKNAYLKKISGKKKLLNIKIYTFNELKKKLKFNYDENTIYYLMKNYDLTYNNSIKYINALYHLNDNKKLNDIYNDLDKNDLLIKEPFFIPFLKQYKVNVAPFYGLLNSEEHVIEELKKYTDVEIFNHERNFKHKIYEFETINDELNFVADDIIKNNYDFNDVLIANVNSDYKEQLRKIFNFYNININIENKISLYNTNDVKKYIKTKNINSIRDTNIKNKVINILNKLVFIENDEIKDELIINMLKNTYLTNDKYDNSVNIIDFKEDYINDDNIVYLIGFADEFIPRIYKDEDLISNNNKINSDNTSHNKNKVEKEIILNKIKNTKNLTVTYSSNNYSISSLSDGLDKVKKKFDYTNYSNDANIYNLSLKLDDFYNYNIKDDDINKLYYNYKDNPYNTYSNEFTKIDNFKLDSLSLSYSKLNTYFESPFKFYIKYILKLESYEDNFNTYLGNYVHEILSYIYNDDFDLKEYTNNFIKNNDYEMTNENKFYFSLLKREMINIINYLKSFDNDTLYKDIEEEKAIKIKPFDDLNVEFVGFIDRIMKHNNNIIVIDYKTSSNLNHYLDLSMAHHGLKLQLPTYMYLANKVYENANITGIYLQGINRPKANEKIEDNLRFVGYTLDDIDTINNINEKYLRNVAFKSDGDLTAYSKVLSKEDFSKLIRLVDKKIRKAAEDIFAGKFDIKPKVIDNQNISTKYCTLNDISFRKAKDNVYLERDRELSYLEEL